MALNVKQIAERVEALKNKYAERDNRMQTVLAVREGNMASVGIDFFPEGMDHPMVANFIDVAARDIAEVMSPLPTINCGTSSLEDSAKKLADRKTQLANHYIQFSDLETQNYVGMDWYNTYSTYNVVVEPDFEAQMPRIRIDNPLNAYPEYDRFGRVVAYAKRFKKTTRELTIEFPEYEFEISRMFDGAPINWNKEWEVVRWEDKDQTVLYVHDTKLLLASVPNPIGKILVRIGRRPHINPDNPRGQFDDVVWVQLARARFAFLAMEAAEKSVQAPIAVPNDVQEFAFGPDAILRSQNPQSIRRVGLELPTGAFTEQQVLEGEMRMGSRYPEGRSGQIDANIITGQGVQALLGGFDTQVKSAQQIVSRVLEEAVSLCFEMDETLFNFKKTASGLYQGAPYKFDYKPSTAIKGDYSVQVRYGLMSGLDPSRALIFSLQAMGAGLMSKEFAMNEMPFEMNVTDVQKQIEIEKMREALAGAFTSVVGAIPQMAAQGGDPSKIIMQISDVIQARKSGISIEEAVAKVFAPEPQQQVAPEVAPAGPQPVEAATVPAAPGPEQMAAGAPPQGGAPQGASPDIMSMLQQMGGQA
jgi:hypothetical protein